MIVGYVGPFGDVNFGDYAMLVNDVYDIGVKNIKLFTYDAEFLISKIIKEYFGEYVVQTVQVDIEMKEESVYTGKVATHHLNERIYTPIEIMKLIENQEEICTHLKAIDVLVVTGGGYFNHYWTAKSRLPKLLTIMGTILLANRLGKKIVFMGNTYGPFDESGEVFKAFFSKLRNVIFASRDICFSKTNMRSIGINNDIHLLPDDLFFINEQLQWESKCMPPEKYIVLELCVSLKEIEDHEEQIKLFVSDIQKRYGYKVYILPVDKGYGDWEQAKLLKELCLDVIIIDDVIKEGLLSIARMLEIISGAEFVICQKYHMFTMCIAYDIPVVQVLRDIWGDMRYSYNKSVGVLDNNFGTHTVDEQYYFITDLNELPQIAIHLEDYKNVQGCNIKMKYENAKLERLEYIEKYICTKDIK